MAEANNIVKDFKAPPILGKDFLHVIWKIEIRIWEPFTAVLEEKRAPAIFMTLTKLTVSNLMAELGKMYLNDESSQAYEAYDTSKMYKAFRYEHI